MILFGAGGHGKVVISLLEDQHEPISAILDDDPGIVEVLGHRVFHPDNYTIINEEPLIISVGNNKIRYEKAAEFKGHLFGKVVHSTAVVTSHIKVDMGTVVMPFAVIHPSCIIGQHCIINTRAIIEHDCSLENFVHVAPGSTICGGVAIGEGTLIGAGAIVLPGIRIGSWCTIGAGSVVTRNVADGQTVFGNPAKTR